ncbi:MAG: helix-turn-helix domain-containing protein [Galbitalea sp.]
MTVFADAPIEMAAAGAPDVAAEVVTSVLGGVLRLPEFERSVLFATVDEWFRQGGSVNATAGVLFVHPNTVRNRLRPIRVAHGPHPRPAEGCRRTVFRGRDGATAAAQSRGDLAVLG